MTKQHREYKILHQNIFGGHKNLPPQNTLYHTKSAFLNGWSKSIFLENKVVINFDFRIFKTLSTVGRFRRIQAAFWPHVTPAFKTSNVGTDDEKEASSRQQGSSSQHKRRSFHVIHKQKDQNGRQWADPCQSQLAELIEMALNQEPSAAYNWIFS